jgi:hypothetical protein
MTVKCINEVEQWMIVRAFTSKAMNQTELADAHGVHRRTIQRVLIDHGVISYKTRGPKSVTPRVQVERKQQILDLVPATHNTTLDGINLIHVARAHGHNADSLDSALSLPAFDRASIELHLSMLEHDEYSKIIQVVTKVRNLQHARLIEQRAANA